MRDPNRIKGFCNRLMQTWMCLPDWRFGQLIFNVFSELGRDPFYMEDDEMIQFIENYISESRPQCSYKEERTAEQCMEELLSNIKEWKMRVRECINHDYAIGYISALSTVEGFIASQKCDAIDDEDSEDD